MNIYVIVENGAVVNRTMADTPMGGNWIQSDQAQIGYLFVDGVFVPPPEPAPEIPQKVSRAQFILALLAIGLLDEVEAAVAGADRATQINYAARLEFERSYPLIATMAAVLGKTEAEIDNLFLLASTL